jgi:hypothetical protein
MTPVDSLQACLAAQHAALYGYGALGGRLAGVAPGSTWQGLASAAYVEHRDLRDSLAAAVRGLDAEPVVAEASYATPFPLDSLDDCRRLARLLERRCGATYADAVAETLQGTRALLAHALQASAVRATRWGAAVTAFPGLDDR